MKKIIRISTALLLFALLLLPTKAWAQTMVGVQGGLSIASLVGDDVDDDEFDSRTGLLGGAFVAIPVAERIGFSTGLYYAQKGATDAQSGADFEIRANYLEIPVILQVALAGNRTTGFSAFAGPSISFEMSCEIEGSEGGVSVTADCEDFDVETKSTLFGAIVGVGVRHALSGGMALVANGGLDFGLTSVDDSADEEDVKTRMWFAQIGVGWTLGDGM